MIISKSVIFNTLFDTSIKSITLHPYNLSDASSNSVNSHKGMIVAARTATREHVNRHGWRFFINQSTGSYYNFNKSACKYSLYEEEYL
jgi:hypothetical protein